MLIPAMLRGDKIKVRRSCRKVANALGEGVALRDALGAERVDLSSASGRILLAVGNAATSDDFPVYLFGDELLRNDACLADIFEPRSRLFTELVTSDWGMLCLLPPWSGCTIVGPEKIFGKFRPYAATRIRIFLERTYELWPELIGLGERFTIGLGESGYDLLLDGNSISTLHMALFAIGSRHLPSSVDELHEMIKQSVATDFVLREG